MNEASGLRIARIRIAYALGGPVKAIAYDYGVSETYVSQVCNRAGQRRRKVRSDIKKPRR